MLDEEVTGGPPSYLVAAKTVNDSNNSPEAMRELQSEALVMAQVTHHPNLVSLVGVITRGDPLVLVISYCEHGSLLSLLRTQAKDGSPLSAEVKLKLGLQAARGMEHLASLSFVHRDLAARNVLVATGMVAQVADFGLSRGVVLDAVAGADDDGGVDGESMRTPAAGGYYRSQTGVFPIRFVNMHTRTHTHAHTQTRPCRIFLNGRD